MEAIMITAFFALIWWGMFLYSFSKDRSRYRNCHLLFLALLSLIPFVINISGQYAMQVIMTT